MSILDGQVFEAFQFSQGIGCTLGMSTSRQQARGCIPRAGYFPLKSTALLVTVVHVVKTV